MINIKEVASRVNKTANEKGWWEKDRSDAECIALMHSEISEGWKDQLAPSDKMPDFTAISEEIADMVIRLLDWAVQRGVPIPHTLPPIMPLERGKTETLLNLHGALDFFLLERLRGGEPCESLPLIEVFDCVQDVCIAWNIDLDRVLAAKMLYNEGRPHRHGGKQF